MDSFTQAVLGAAVGVAALGPATKRRVAVGWGAVLGVLPDLDVLLEHGDPVRNMVFHRAESHAFCWLTMVTPLVAWGLCRLHRTEGGFVRWCVAAWLVFVTHVLLDLLTIYGTRCFLPFDDGAYGLGSVFVVDPLYTLPMLAGLFLLALRRGAPGRRWNTIGLVVSTAYLGFGIGMQQVAAARARADLRALGVVPEALLVTPAPLQSLLWRVVALDGDHVLEGFWSLCDDARPIEFDRFDRGRSLLRSVEGAPAVRLLEHFSRGWIAARRDGDAVLVVDLRMGQEPHYAFRFEVARVVDGRIEVLPAPVSRRSRADVGRGLSWLGRRMGGERLPPPR
jgi:inner membrane protein